MKLNHSLLLCILSLFGSFSSQARKKNTPNIVFIYTDDHRYTGVHALGHQAVKTPNLDKLANHGIAFTNTYLMGAFTGATCIASRAMLHTGRNLFQLEGIGYAFGKQNTSMSQAFHSAGYHTHHVGKWHQDVKDLSRVFDSGGLICGKPMYLTDQFRMPYSKWNNTGVYPKNECYLLEYDKNGNTKQRLISENDKKGPIGTEKDGPHVSEVLADDAIGYIKNYDKQEPYFMYLAFPCPHDPRQAPQEYHNMYPVDEIELPPSYMSEHPFDNGHYYTRDEKLAIWPRTPDVAKKQLAEYYAIITHLDAQIGRVISALEATGQFENTIVVMAGDSGLGVGNHGLMGKQNVYDEDGLHVPFIISGGAIAKKYQGKREETLCYIHDIYPTLLDLTGIEKPRSVTGKSMMPVVDKKVESVRDYTYHAYRQHQRAYREGDYKLIEFVRAPDEEKSRGEFISGSRVTLLYNVKIDPWETNNLANFPEYSKTLEQLRSSMLLKAKELNDRPMDSNKSYNFWDYFQ